MRAHTAFVFCLLFFACGGPPASPDPSTVKAPAALAPSNACPAPKPVHAQEGIENRSDCFWDVYWWYGKGAAWATEFINTSPPSAFSTLFACVQAACDTPSPAMQDTCATAAFEGACLEEWTECNK